MHAVRAGQKARNNLGYVVRWRPHGVATEAQVKANFERMAAKVGGQNAGDLVFKVLAQPSGYTEPLLHAWRLKVKAATA